MSSLPTLIKIIHTQYLEILRLNFLVSLFPHFPKVSHIINIGNAEK